MVNYGDVEFSCKLRSFLKDLAIDYFQKILQLLTQHLPFYCPIISERSCNCKQTNKWYLSITRSKMILGWSVMVMLRFLVNLDHFWRHLFKKFFATHGLISDHFNSCLKIDTIYSLTNLTIFYEGVIMKNLNNYDKAVMVLRWCITAPLMTTQHQSFNWI